MEKERKQGFFRALKDEVVRGLSPARSRGKTPARSASPARMLIPRRRKAPPPPQPEKQQHEQYVQEQLIARSGSLRPGGEALEPLIEGPDADRLAAGDFVGEDSGRREGFGHWVRGHLTRTPSMASAGPGGSGGGSFRHSDLRLLLGVMGAPLAPISSTLADPALLLSIKGAPIVRVVVRAVHPAAVHGGVGRLQDAAVGAQRLRHGQGADGGVRVRDGHARRQEPRAQRPRRRRSRAGRLRDLDHGARDVVRRARRRRQQGARRMQRAPRLAPHPLARRPRRQRARPTPPPRPPGPRPADDGRPVRGGAVRGGEEGERRGLLHPQALRRPADAEAAERGPRRDHPARPVRLLQPAHRPHRAHRGLAPHAHPAALRRRRRVLGDHHQLLARGLPRRGGHHDRARGPLRRHALPVRGGGHEPHQDAHGGGLEHRGGGLQRARPLGRLLHPARRHPVRLRRRGLRAAPADHARRPRQDRRRTPRPRRRRRAAHPPPRSWHQHSTARRRREDRVESGSVISVHTAHTAAKN